MPNLGASRVLEGLLAQGHCWLYDSLFVCLDVGKTNLGISTDENVPTISFWRMKRRRRRLIMYGSGIERQRLPLSRCERRPSLT